MDPPEHRSYRSLVSQRFTPRALQRIKEQVDAIADEILDGVMEGGAEAETDFVATVSALLPIWVIAVKAAPGSSQPEKAAVSRRCALEDTGRNSVSPRTSPRTRDSNQDMK